MSIEGCKGVYMHLDNVFRRVIAVGLLSAALLSASACNTMKGAGKDIERGGEKIQDAADRK
jgi:entericidin B